MAALSRMAANIHKKMTIKPNDTIVLSSNPIPGNEKAVSRIINELSMKGANVIFQDVHVSGHACQEEIKLIYSLVKPKYAIPVHGEYRHLIAQAKGCGGAGYSKENIFTASNRCTDSRKEGNEPASGGPDSIVSAVSSMYANPRI